MTENNSKLILWPLALPIALVIVLVACQSSPTPTTTDSNASKTPAAPPTVTTIYPAMLGQQIDRLKRSSASNAHLKAQYDKALDSGQSFRCDFSMNDIALEAEISNANRTLDAYQTRHGSEIRALRSSNQKLRELEALERQLNHQFVTDEQMLKKICQ